MKINSSYPYPVLYLNNEDYSNSSFSTRIDIQDSFGEIIIQANFDLTNQQIQRHMDKEDFVYVLHVECGHTSFRKVYETQKKQLDVRIPTKNLRGKIAIHSFILAKKRVENYNNDYLSEWYSGIPITFDKGNFIAIGEAIETTLFEENEEALNLPSIVTVSSAPKNEFMEVDIYSNNIVVSLPEFEYKMYASSGSSRLKNTILGTVIVPALVYVFSQLPNNNGDLNQYTWYQVLEKIFADNNYRLEDVGTEKLSPLKASQLVLRKPLKTSFEEIEKLQTMED